MTVNQGPQIDQTPWLNYEQQSILDCLSGLYRVDAALYQQGWNGLALLPVARCIGGLAHAVNTLMSYIVEQQAIPDGPEALGWAENLCLRVDPSMGMPPDLLYDTIDVCQGINTEQAWQTILANDSEWLARCLVGYAILAHWTAERQGLELFTFLRQHLAELTAPNPNG